MPFLDRKCTTDYKIPGSDLVLEKGLSIYISVSGIQNDEKYFPEPEKFIPERHENKMNTDKLIFTPFGYGPRICIGKVFFYFQMVQYHKYKYWKFSLNVRNLSVVHKFETVELFYL